MPLGLKVLQAVPMLLTRPRAVLNQLAGTRGRKFPAPPYLLDSKTFWHRLAGPAVWHAAANRGHRVGHLKLRTYSVVPKADYLDVASQEDTIKPLDTGLYLVGTPIGNLEDISLRALRILRTATVVLAEDTRHSKKLLNHFNIKAQLYSFHQHNEHTKEKVVLEQLARGAAVAVISDAGMPLISDPGSALVRAAVAAGYQVIPVPGPSAFLLALVASGLASTQFTFAGFLADKLKGRQQQLQDLAGLTHTLVFYVPPHDLLAVLKDVAAILGSHRQCVIARELTKVHEDFFRSTIADAVDHASNNTIKGEITLLVQGAAPDTSTVSTEDLAAAVHAAMSSGLSLSSAAKTVSKQLGVSRSKAYAAALDASKSQGEAT